MRFKKHPGIEGVPPLTGKCLLCALVARVGVWDSETGACVCAKCRDDARAAGDIQQVCLQLVADASGKARVDSASTLVLYFPTDEDRNEFATAFREVKPNCKTVKL